MLAAIDATFAEIRAIFMGTSANFPSTIVVSAPGWQGLFSVSSGLRILPRLLRLAG